MAAEKDKEFKLPFYLGAQPVVWQYRDEYSSWKDYPKSVSQKCERGYWKLQSGDRSAAKFEYEAAGGNRYEIDIQQMRQRNKSSYYGGRRQIQRKGPEPIPQGNKKSLNKLFEKYCDSSEDPDSMSEAGFQKFYRDIKVPMEGVNSLVVAACVDAQEMGSEFTRTEFVDGWACNGCSNLKDIQRLVRDISHARMKERAVFRQFYKWLFDYAKGENQRAKSIDKGLATAIWEIVLDTKACPLRDVYITFVTDMYEESVISKDAWNQSLEFLYDTKADLSNYVDDGSWPIVIDDFVESRQK